MPDHPSVQIPTPEPRAPAVPPASPGGSAPVGAGVGLERAVYDVRTLTELEAIFGRPKLMDLIGRLRDEIAQRLRAPVADRAALGRDAHTLLSVSGSLGFTELSRCCTELEQACLLGADLGPPLEAAHRASARSIAAIDAMAARA